MTRWKPIESAPKNGTAILVYAPMARLRKIKLAKYKKYSYWKDDMKLYDYHGNYVDASHWMPLPISPMKEKKVSHDFEIQRRKKGLK